MVLILDDQVEQYLLANQHLGQRREEPGAQGVGIQRGDHHQRRVAAFGEFGHQVGFEQSRTLEVLQQALAGRGGATGPAAYHQGAAECAFQRTHPLRNRRRGEVQPCGGLFEAAGLDDEAEGLSLPGIEIHAVAPD